MPSKDFVAIYGEDLAKQIEEITRSPEQQKAARELEAQLSADKRREELQVLKEISDAADNGVYGKEGQRLAERFAPVDGVRTYYQQVGLKNALQDARLLKRSGNKR